MCIYIAFMVPIHGQKLTPVSSVQCPVYSSPPVLQCWPNHTHSSIPGNHRSQPPSNNLHLLPYHLQQIHKNLQIHIPSKTTKPPKTHQTTKPQLSLQLSLPFHHHHFIHHHSTSAPRKKLRGTCGRSRPQHTPSPCPELSTTVCQAGQAPVTLAANGDFDLEVSL